MAGPESPTPADATPSVLKQVNDMKDFNETEARRQAEGAEAIFGAPPRPAESQEAKDGPEDVKKTEEAGEAQVEQSDRDIYKKVIEANFDDPDTLLGTLSTLVERGDETVNAEIRSVLEEMIEKGQDGAESTLEKFNKMLGQEAEIRDSHFESETVTESNRELNEKQKLTENLRGLIQDRRATSIINGVQRQEEGGEVEQAQRVITSLMKLGQEMEGEDRDGVLVVLENIASNTQNSALRESAMNAYNYITDPEAGLAESESTDEEGEVSNSNSNETDLPDIHEAEPEGIDERILPGLDADEKPDFLEANLEDYGFVAKNDSEKNSTEGDSDDPLDGL